MVDKFAVLLILEVGELARISYEVVNHLLKDFLEIFHHQGFLDRSLVITAGVEGEEGIEKAPESLQVVAEILSFYIPHLAFTHACVKITLDFRYGPELIRNVTYGDRKMKFVSQILQHRIVEDDKFLVYVDGLVLDLEIQVVRLSVVDVRVLEKGLVPVDGRTSRVVDLVDLCEEVAVVREEVDEAAQKIAFEIARLLQGDAHTLETLVSSIKTGSESQRLQQIRELMDAGRIKTDGKNYYL